MIVYIGSFRAISKKVDSPQLYLNTSESDGNAYYNFNPGCNYEVGNHTWLAGTTDSRYMLGSVYYRL